ncbi:neurotransmitter-gated ion-channel ligand binding domain-containing protein [Ditylenchus destructor]|nr:neurotransmitter-gated ion-channel ligand binding domain-containing protein [Ditylenchus destructor]
MYNDIMASFRILSMIDGLGRVPVYCLAGNCLFPWSSEVPLSEFFNYTNGHGISATNTILSKPFPFFGELCDSLEVNMYGFISFNGFMRSSDPPAPPCEATVRNYSTIAPYWFETNIGGDITWDHIDGESEKVRSEIISAFPIFHDIKLKWFLVATWLNMYINQESHEKDRDAHCSMQAIITTDGVRSFVIFYYNEVKYPEYAPFFIGFDTGHGHRNGRHIIAAGCPGTRKALVANESNVDSPGKWVFRVDKSIIYEPDSHCPALPISDNGYCHPLDDFTLGSEAVCGCFKSCASCEKVWAGSTPECDVKDVNHPTLPTTLQNYTVDINTALPTTTVQPSNAPIFPINLPTTVPEIYYISYENVEPIFGLEIAEELLKKYAFVAINFVSSSTFLQLGSEVQLLPTDDKDDEKEQQIQQRLSEELGRKIELDKPVEVDEDDKSVGVGGEIWQNVGPIGIDLASFDEKQIKSLEKAVRGENDTELDDIFSTIRWLNVSKQKPFASTLIIPIMKRTKYDPRTAPRLIEGQIVHVRVGIHVQSISNFQLTTMDYDMDMWLRMCWRDPRLAHGLKAPILITEESYLKKIWRPDAFFVNSVDSLFHRVTYLNFYMFVFPDGEVYFESRLYLKPKSLLVLCKYPHDSQTIFLRISSIAFTNNTVQFKWFSRREQAININRNVQLPELYIAGVENTQCASRRKTGNFSCIEARFYMKRNIGFYFAQTYLPTATCVIFSWISVWLPEEFVEGRVFVALTVFLTLSAESNAAKETLPKVSYVKAIDIWFGFTATFVFATMFQAMVVISLEHLSKQMKKTVEEQNESLSVHRATQMLLDSKRYHSWGRGLDEFFKVMYPVIMVTVIHFNLLLYK